MGQPGRGDTRPSVAGGQLGQASLPGNVGAPPPPVRLLAAWLPHPGPGDRQGTRTGWPGSLLDLCRLHKADLLHPLPLSPLALVTDVGLTHEEFQGLIQLLQRSRQEIRGVFELVLCRGSVFPL